MESDRQHCSVPSKQPCKLFKQGGNIPSFYTHTCCITVWSSESAGRYMGDNRSVSNFNRSRHRSQSLSLSYSPLLSFGASVSQSIASSTSSTFALHPIRKRRTSHSGSLTLNQPLSSDTASAGVNSNRRTDQPIDNSLAPRSTSRSSSFTTAPPRTKRKNRRAIRQSFGTSRTQYKMPFLEAHYHPFLFAMMMLCSIAELGLTSFLISAGNENGTWPSPRYHAL